MAKVNHNASILNYITHKKIDCEKDFFIEFNPKILRFCIMITMTKPRSQKEIYFEKIMAKYNT